MWNVDWGKIVKDARMDYGMTQEELSWGICNVSTLSRIETGHTDPSLQNIEAIFNKLELSDSMVELLAYVCGGEVARLRALVRQALIYGKTQRAEEILTELKPYVCEENKENRLYFEFMLFMSRVQYLLDMGMSLEQAEQNLGAEACVWRMINLLHPNVDPSVRDFSDFGSMAYTNTELMILNANAMGDCHSGDVLRGKSKMESLFSIAYRLHRPGEQYHAMMAALSINLASIYMKDRDYGLAELVLHYGIRQVMHAYRPDLHMKMLRLSCELNGVLHRYEARNDACFALHTIYEYLPVDLRPVAHFDDLWKLPIEVFIF